MALFIWINVENEKLPFRQTILLDQDNPDWMVRQYESIQVWVP